MASRLNKKPKRIDLETICRLFVYYVADILGSERGANRCEMLDAVAYEACIRLVAFSLYVMRMQISYSLLPKRIPFVHNIQIPKRIPTYA